MDYALFFLALAAAGWGYVSLNARLNSIMTDIADLAENVATIETIGDALIARFEHLKIELDAVIASQDLSALPALSARLQAQAEEMRAALAAVNAPAPADPAPADPAPVDAAPVDAA